MQFNLRNQIIYISLQIKFVTFITITQKVKIIMNKC